MKEATGELNMTVITLVAISAIGAVFYFLVWPMVQRTLASRSCETAYGPDFRATQMAKPRPVRVWYQQILQGVNNYGADLSRANRPLPGRDGL